MFGSRSIIVDFGTATTFDVVDGEGNYCGGVIAPGINLSLEALHMARPPSCRASRSTAAQAAIGKDTLTAMQSGIYWGYVGLIEGLVTRIRAEFGGAADGDRDRRPGAAVRQGDARSIAAPRARDHHARPGRDLSAATGAWPTLDAILAAARRAPVPAPWAGQARSA